MSHASRKTQRRAYGFPRNNPHSKSDQGPMFFAPYQYCGRRTPIKSEGIAAVQGGIGELYLSPDSWQCWLLLEIEIPYLLAVGKFIGAQMSEIVADREQRSVDSHTRIAPSFYSYFDSQGRFRTFAIAID